MVVIGDDRRRVRIAAHVSHEGHVNLEVVHGQLLHVAQGRVAGAEVVDRDRDAHPFQLAEELRGEVDVANADALGQLQRQMTWVPPTSFEITKQVIGHCSY
jgi:hypothetical protein